jgi:ribosomal protein S18 acetylase RimI-like enzyme
MKIVIHAIHQDNLTDVGHCDGAFMVDAKLVLAATNNAIQFTVVDTPPHRKQYPVDPVNYRAYIDHPDKTILLAYVDGAIGGEIRICRNWNRYAYIEDIVVDVAYRRRGVGRALIQAAVEWAKDRRLPGVMLETQNNNVAACRFYQQCGFELGGFDRRLYQGLHPDTDEIALFWYLLFPPEL